MTGQVKRHVRVVIDKPGAKARFVELPPVLILDEVWRLPTNVDAEVLRALARRSRSPLPLQRPEDLGIDVDLDVLARATGRLLPERRPLQIWQRLEDLGVDVEPDGR